MFELIHSYYTHFYDTYFKSKQEVYNEIIKKYGYIEAYGTPRVKCNDLLIAVRLMNGSFIYNSLSEFDIVYEKYRELLDGLNVFNIEKFANGYPIIFIGDLPVFMNWNSNLLGHLTFIYEIDNYYCNTVQELVNYISRNYPEYIKNTDIKIALKG